MKWLNKTGLAFVILLLIPNIVYGLFGEMAPMTWRNPAIELLEQVGRFGCMAFMAVSLPGQGFRDRRAERTYMILGAVLMTLYWMGWIVFWGDSSLIRALVLSILPSLLFLESGVLTRSLPLSVTGVLFAVCHILISVKNV